MKIYWKEDTTTVMGEDPHGNKTYVKEEKYGESIGAAYSRTSGYSKILIAVQGGKFVTKHSYECYHKEF